MSPAAPHPPATEQITSDAMATGAALQLASLLDRATHPSTGDALPILWHWAYFLPTIRQCDIGPDGHPRRTDDYVDRFPRRMAAGGSIDVLAPLRLGTPATRRSRIDDVVEKTGRTGPLMLVRWTHHIEQDQQLRVTEQQTVIYRAAATGTRTPALTPKPAGAAGPARRAVFDPVLLFRFSAATGNPHRIHYDRPYARREGYPGLVVHGPLVALLLAEAAQGTVGALSRFEYRALAPVFVDDAVEVVLDRDAGGIRAEARHLDGTVAMAASAR